MKLRNLIICVDVEGLLNFAVCDVVLMTPVSVSDEFDRSIFRVHENLIETSLHVRQPT